MSDTKVWFITGCSSGFGRSLVKKVLKNGYSVVATARDIKKLSDIESEYGEKIRVVKLDVTKNNQITEAVNSAVDSFGKIDVLVNNAGYGLVGALEEYSEGEMHKNFNTNFWAPINIIRKVLPVMRVQKSGHIINISAGAAIMNETGFSIYAASKAALDLASEALCWELKPLGINVTNVVPGPFRTEFITRSLNTAENNIDDYDQTVGKFVEFLDKIDGKQPGDPDKAAEAIINITKLEKPPLYLYLGEYAYKSANRKIKTMKKYLDDFEDIGLHTDFD
jgi:short-subunit dehydrogenase